MSFVKQEWRLLAAALGLLVVCAVLVAWAWRSDVAWEGNCRAAGGTPHTRVLNTVGVSSGGKVVTGVTTESACVGADGRVIWVK